MKCYMPGIEAVLEKEPHYRGFQGLRLVSFYMLILQRVYRICCSAQLTEIPMHLDLQSIESGLRFVYRMVAGGTVGGMKNDVVLFKLVCRCLDEDMQQLYKNSRQTPLENILRTSMTDLFGPQCVPRNLHQVVKQQQRLKKWILGSKDMCQLTTIFLDPDNLSQKSGGGDLESFSSPQDLDSLRTESENESNGDYRVNPIQERPPGEGANPGRESKPGQDHESPRKPINPKDDPRRINNEDESARNRLRLKRLLEPFEGQIIDYSLSYLTSINTIVITKYGDEELVVFEPASLAKIESNYSYYQFQTLRLQRTQPEKDPRRVKLIGVV